MENNKAARFARGPFGFLLFSIWQWKPRTKNLMEIDFLLRAGPTFGPELKTDFGWRWPLIKNPGPLIKNTCFLIVDPIIKVATREGG